MPIRKILLEGNTYYHIYNRGINKKRIFYSEQDYERFYEKVLFYSEKFQIKIYAWAFLPNHFHFLLSHKTSLDLCHIESFVAQISKSHALYFNLKYGFTGALFQGRFKAKEISSEKYFVCLLNYINSQHSHHKKIASPSERFSIDKKWKYSSLHDYLGNSVFKYPLTQIDDKLIKKEDYQEILLISYADKNTDFNSDNEEELFSSGTDSSGTD